MMEPSRQSMILTRLIENVPSIVFFAALYALDDLRMAGWMTWPFVVAVFAGYGARKFNPNTIMLGINLYMLVVIPTAEILLLLDQKATALRLADHALSLVLVAIFLTGCVLTFFTKNGFVGIPCPTRKTNMQYSGTLLGVSFLTVLWSFIVEAERMIEVGIPLLILFGTQHLLQARILDQRTHSDSGPLVALGFANLSDLNTDLSA